MFINKHPTVNQHNYPVIIEFFNPDARLKYNRPTCLGYNGSFNFLSKTISEQQIGLHPAIHRPWNDTFTLDNKQTEKIHVTSRLGNRVILTFLMMVY